ncbi:MAG: HAD family phosphatase [Verrucomicrobiales bacterium]|nr:HAD family phosphatase [Verrucomicrobiales bacterium]
MNPKAVVFDLGKVLLHFDYGIAAEKFERRCALSTGGIRQAIDQSPLLHGFETNQLSTEQFFAALSEATGFEGDLAAFSEIFCNVFSPIEPMIRLQAQLRERGLPTYIFSNTNFLQIEHIRRSYPFFANFDGYVLSCEHGVMKPDQELYEVVERLTGRRGRDLLYIDDRAENIDAGAERGWQTIHHTDPQITCAAVKRAGLLG